MIKIDNISLPIGFDNEKIKEICAKNLEISTEDIKNFELLKLSLDARRKNNIKYVASIALDLEEEIEKKCSHLHFKLDRKPLFPILLKTFHFPLSLLDLDQVECLLDLL